MLTYKVKGKKDAPCIVFIHGYALHESVWNQVCDLLSDKWMSVLIRLPRTQTQMFKQADQIEESICLSIHQVLKALRLNRVHIAGHSMGGYLALGFLERYPALVDKIILVNSTFTADMTDRQHKRQKIVTHLETYGTESFLMQAVPSWFEPNYKQLNYVYINKMIHQANDIETGILVTYQKYMMERKDRTFLFNHSPQKDQLLVLLGEYDTLISDNDFKGIANTISLEDTAHMTMIEQPRLVAQHINQFCVSA